MYGCRCLGVVAPAPTLLCLFADWLLHIDMASYYPSTSYICRLLFLANLLYGFVHVVVLMDAQKKSSDLKRECT
jgi:hypothetical protein